MIVVSVISGTPRAVQRTCMKGSRELKDLRNNRERIKTVELKETIKVGVTEYLRSLAII